MPAAFSLRRLLSAPFAVTPRCSTLFRRWVALLVLLEAASRWDALRWLYTDSSALPRRSVLPDPAEDPLAWAVCAHAWHGSLAWAQALTALQASAAIGLFFGARGAGVLAWWLHLSACLRVPPLIFILDRYLHLLLAFAVLLPTPPPSGGSSLASLLLAVQLVAIYQDAGGAKLRDPAAAWSLDAPVAALDTYLRHTRPARAAHALLGGAGLRLAGAAAVAVELTAAPLALAAPTVGLRRVFVVCGAGLHVIIALTMRHTALLSMAAIGVWIPFWDGPRLPPRERGSGHPAAGPSLVVRG